MLNVVTKEPVTDEATLREAVRAEIASGAISRKAAGDEAGVGYSTICAWLNGTYREGAEKETTAKIARWMEARVARADLRRRLPEAPGYVATPTAQEIMGRLMYVHGAQEFGVIVGPAGIGKTMTLEEYQRAAPNVYLITADRASRSANAIIAILAEELKITEQRAVWRPRAIAKKVRNEVALIIIDEAQFLTTDALDQLRALPEAGRCGVIVAGNETLLGRLTGEKGANSALYAQLHSRVGARWLGKKPRAGDIDMLIAAWGISDAGAAALLRKIGDKAGALRLLTKTMRLASVLAAGEEAEAVEVAHIRAAFEQISASPLDKD